MKGLGSFIAAAAALAATAVATPTRTDKLAPRQTTSGGLPVVTVRGNAFWQGDERFYIRGVAYQPGGAAGAQDPLLDMEGLRRDVERFRELGINTIRIYSIDNSENHDEAMRLLDEAGIYLALDANTPLFSINREDPYLSYNERYLQSVFATIDNMASYNNLLLLFSGNEVIDDRETTNTAPYVKATTRDMKTYIANRGYRPIPVGYSAADVSANINQQFAYFDCGEDIERGDFFAFNDYSWCDPSSFTQSGWDRKVQNYTGYAVPLFLSEFGCIQNTRQWNEIGSLYSTDTSAVYSGGLAYEYTVEPNGYGLVELVNNQVTPNDDYYRLKDKYAAQSNPSGDGGYQASNQKKECPPITPEWEVQEQERLPAMPAGAQRYMTEGAGTGPGLDPDANSSQTGGETYAGDWVEPGSSQPTGTNAVVSSTGGSSQASATGAAVSVKVPELHFAMLVAGGVVLASSLAGAALL